MPTEQLLVADIGGTTARFGIATMQDCHTHIAHECELACAEFADFESALSTYWGTLNGAEIRHACIAVAGPVNRNPVALTNLDWQISSEKIRRMFGLKRIEIINDFAAIACAVPHLPSNQYKVICEGERVPGSPVAIVGPGTGLGVSALLPSGNGWSVLPGEGGHALLASTSLLEAEIIRRVGGDRGVTAETLVCGPGIFRIYKALCDIRGRAPAATDPIGVTHAMLNETDAIATEAMAVFCRFLGVTVRNAVLTYNALGGVFLAGGILPIIESFLSQSEFEKSLRQYDKENDYLRDLPVALLTTRNAGLIGAASWARSNQPTVTYAA